MKPSNKKQDSTHQQLEAKLRKRLDEKAILASQIQRLRQKIVLLENRIDRITILLNDN